ncbi:MAG: response regulator transcription factor [Bacteroidia bacterium]|nr:response regulator transcription factor [Bacteroidia bacterium]
MHNPTLSAIIVDDELFAVANLSNLLTSYCPTIKISDTARCGATAIQKINSQRPDVVFMDVNMPQQNGFDVLAHLQHLPSIVFVTAHEEHALRAMKVCAVDFLLKPIDVNELVQTEIKLLQLHAIKPEIRENYRMVLRNLTAMLDKPGSIRKITLPGNNGYEILELDELIYLTGEDNYTSFHFMNQRQKMVAKTLKDYEEMLEHFGFMRIHKSTLINLSHVKKVLRSESMEVQMSNGDHLNVSRRRMPELQQWAKHHTI